MLADIYCRHSTDLQYKYILPTLYRYILPTHRYRYIQIYILPTFYLQTRWQARRAFGGLLTCGVGPKHSAQHQQGLQHGVVPVTAQQLQQVLPLLRGDIGKRRHCDSIGHIC